MSERHVHQRFYKPNGTEIVSGGNPDYARDCSYCLSRERLLTSVEDLRDELERRRDDLLVDGHYILARLNQVLPSRVEITA